MLELMPDGETFKKLTKAQGDALHRYYKREHDSLLVKTLPPLISTGLPAIFAIGLGAAAYVFKDELEEELLKSGESAIDWLGSGLFKFSGVGQALRLVGPTTPEFIILEDGTKVGPLSRCKRWETDLVDLTEKNVGALIPVYLKAMKDDGCSKPVFVTKKNWDKV
jgi:hypothetical protein